MDWCENENSLGSWYRAGGGKVDIVVDFTAKRLVSGSLVGNIFAQWIVLFVNG